MKKKRLTLADVSGESMMLFLIDLALSYRRLSIGYPRTEKAFLPWRQLCRHFVLLQTLSLKSYPQRLCLYISAVDKLIHSLCIQAPLL